MNFVLLAEWTPEQVTGLVNAVLTGILAIVGAVTAYLMKRQANRVEVKTDQQTETLAKQDQTLSEVTEHVKEIRTDVQNVAKNQ